MYRVFISTPGDLEDERLAAHNVLSPVLEKDGMPYKILLVPVGLRDNEHIVGYRAAVTENIRQCTYYIQVFQDDWGPRNLFKKAFHTAEECRGDSGRLMREIVVLLKDAPHETDPEILAFRKELAEWQGDRVFTYAKLDEFQTILTGIYTAWLKNLVGDAASSASA